MDEHEIDKIISKITGVPAKGDVKVVIDNRPPPLKRTRFNKLKDEEDFEGIDEELGHENPEIDEIL